MADDGRERADEAITIEELSQKLESLEKDNEQIRRENQLFQSYLLRKNSSKSIHADSGDDEPEIEKPGRGKGRRGAKQAQQEKVLLTSEEKYEIANAELEALRRNIEEGRAKSEELLEGLKAFLEETDLSIAEIKREAYEFKRDIVVGSENARTGKVVAERIIKYMEEKIRQKDALLEKFEIKNEQLQAHIHKTKKQIKQKEEMGDDLKFIDFHQLQIENKKHVKDIDERNRKLLTLKSTTGKTVQTLNTKKRELNEVMKHNEDLQVNIEARKKDLDQIEHEITDVREEKESARSDNKKLNLQHQRIANMPQVIDYVRQKKELSDLEVAVKNLQRKIEIAEFSAKKAHKIIRENEMMHQV